MLSKRRAGLNVFKDDFAINFGNPNHVIRLGKRLCNEVSSARLAILNGNRDRRWEPLVSTKMVVGASCSPSYTRFRIPFKIISTKLVIALLRTDIARSSSYTRFRIPFKIISTKLVIALLRTDIAGSSTFIHGRSH
ncbi:hypothetical protein SD81_030915 [Tolypothrix campylonemoides VB511288]|nr:hypothetical protein SD81_030915 [Tolypothrix campylonemoides VB511288]